MLEKGMKVKVRNDLEIGRSYGDIIFDSFMGLFKGKEVTILQHVKTSCAKMSYIDIYYVEESFLYYPWTEDMFEPIEENPMPKLKSGMFIKNELNHYGVIAGEKIIYHHGGYDILSKVINRDGYIKQIIEDDYGFNDLKNGKIIWEHKEKEKDKPKTYLEDFTERYPRFQNDYVCAGLCYDFSCPNVISCKDCWDAPKGTWE